MRRARAPFQVRAQNIRPNVSAGPTLRARPQSLHLVGAAQPKGESMGPKTIEAIGAARGLVKTGARGRGHVHYGAT